MLSTPSGPTLKKILVFLIAALGLAGLSAFSKQDTASVAHVLDGDTIILSDGRHVRYIGINAPEAAREKKAAEPWGNQALSFNQSLVGGKTVRLEYDKDAKDHYGRRLAYVYLTDNTFVNREIVLQGLAHCLLHPANTKHSHGLLQAQKLAMDNQKGLWAGWSQDRQTLAGNSRSMRFHLPGCPYAKQTSPGNRVWFHSLWTAFYQGYSPCKECLPSWWKAKE